VYGFCSQKIKRKIGTTFKGMKIFYIKNKDFAKTDNLYSLLLAEKYVTSDIIFMNADQIVDKDTTKRITTSLIKDFVVTDCESAIDADAMRVRFDRKGHLLAIGKRIPGKANGSAIGIYKLSYATAREYFVIAKQYFNRGPRRGGFVVPLRSLLKKKKIKIFPIGKRWIEIDTPADLEKAQKRIHEIM
jgi:choline kinase